MGQLYIQHKHYQEARHARQNKGASNIQIHKLHKTYHVKVTRHKNKETQNFRRVTNKNFRTVELSSEMAHMRFSTMDSDPASTALSRFAATFKQS